MCANSTKPNEQPDEAEIEAVLKELLTIRETMIASTVKSQRFLDEVHSKYRDSARNLIHYLAFRRHDHRPLQLRLAKMGLSSLGRAEPNILATVDAVLSVLHRLTRRDWQPATQQDVVDFSQGKLLLDEHTKDVLGPGTPGRGVRIMVTMPSEAADDDSIVHNLLHQGMDCMRINCAHDDATTWRRMIKNLKHAEASLGRSCQIVMDLAGPKLRTGPLAPGPSVVKIRPRRDLFGRVTAPARIWFTSESSPQSSPASADANFSVPITWLEQLRMGENVELTDARGSRRRWRVVAVTDRGCWAEATKTAYVVPGTVLKFKLKSVKEKGADAVVGEIPATPNGVLLKTGDQLVITCDLTPGTSATYDSGGRLLNPASIGCSIPEVFEDVQPGDGIWFDDGKIGGVVEKVEKDRILVRITQARARGERLLADKGINLPDSPLRLAALTPKDFEDLKFVAEHANVVELSFANTVEDVELLQKHLVRYSDRQPAIVLKIETRRGFENLPEMLLAAMRMPQCGIMIARGDLAVEVGFERLAEVQEEILWICEAAHVPVIWATQVLETLAKDGMPSRAEITDAAMGDRAECVMLNKGPHMLSAVRVLDDILRRMQTHQAKKRALLRELQLAHSLSPKRNVRHAPK